MSIDCRRTLSSAHWFPCDSQVVASLQMGELLIWDTMRTGSVTQNIYCILVCIFVYFRRPTLSNGIFTEPGGQLKFSSSTDLVALLNRVENVLQVLQIQNKQQRLYTKVNVPTNISWHFQLPYVAVGDDTKVLFWKVSSK